MEPGQQPSGAGVPARGIGSFGGRKPWTTFSAGLRCRDRTETTTNCNDPSVDFVRPLVGNSRKNTVMAYDSDNETDWGAITRNVLLLVLVIAGIGVWKWMQP